MNFEKNENYLFFYTMRPYKRQCIRARRIKDGTMLDNIMIPPSRFGKISDIDIDLDVIIEHRKKDITKQPLSKNNLHGFEAANSSDVPPS